MFIIDRRQAPRRDYVAYSFEFWEVIEDSGETRLVARTTAASGEVSRDNTAAGEAQWHTVAAGDTLWELARRYGTALTRLVELNPSIRNPNLIYPGQRVRVK